MSNHKRWVEFLLIALSSVFLVFSFFPMIIMIITSVKSKLDVRLGLFNMPSKILWENYEMAYKAVIPYTINSLIIAIAVVIGVVAISALASFALARYVFPGRELFYYLIISLMMVPSVLTLIPAFKVVAALQLLNTHWVVILPQIAGGSIMAVFLLRAFFAGLPEELFESLGIDGASEWTILLRLVLPLSKPILGTIAVLNFHSSWNDYIWPLITINDQKLKPIVTGIMSFSNSYSTDYGPMMAGYVLASVPLMLVIGFSMRYFVQGLTGGAIKA